MVTTLEHTATSAQPKGGGLARHQNFATAIVGGVILAWVFWFLARRIFWSGSDNWSDQVAVMTGAGWMIGFWIGIGAFNAPFRWLFGRDNTREDDLYYAGQNLGRARYWKYTTDHKVVGVQYIITTMSLLAVGGILAMAIRTELIVPGNHFVNQQVYNGFIAIHGMVMILALIVATGPVGQLCHAHHDWGTRHGVSAPERFGLVDVGECSGASRDRPRGRRSARGLGGPRHDWGSSGRRYGLLRARDRHLNGVDDRGQHQPDHHGGHDENKRNDARPASDLRVGHRHHGDARAVRVSVLLRRRVEPDPRPDGFDKFYIAAGGGTSWLQANLFWLMGHPEVYVILIPAVAALFEISSVMARKPVFSYRTAVGAMVALAGLSAVWAHHMFTSGWAPTLGGPFMVTTELISIPTGIFFLVLVGTLWRGNVWMKLPTVWMFGFIFNFIIGGVTGIYLSDVPLDKQLHGTMFVTAHFHYIFVGSVLFVRSPRWPSGSRR